MSILSGIGERGGGSVLETLDNNLMQTIYMRGIKKSIASVPETPMSESHTHQAKALSSCCTFPQQGEFSQRYHYSLVGAETFSSNVRGWRRLK